MLPTPKPSILNISSYIPGKAADDPDRDFIKLSSNENPYGANPLAVAAFNANNNNLHRYPDGAANNLRKKIAEKNNIPAEQILCGAGSDELIGLLVHAYAGAGDEVLYSQYGFLMYNIYANASGATPVAAAETNLTTDVDALLAAVTPRTKIVFVANPNNPTGSYISTAELKRLRTNLPENVILALDSAYAEYVEKPDYNAGEELVAGSNNVVMLRTFSKIYGLAALRIGWMYAPENIIDSLNRIRSPFNTSQPSQTAVIAALEDTNFVPQQRELNRKNRTELCNKLQALGVTPLPSEGNFLLVDFGTDTKAKKVLHELENRYIFVRSVNSYGLYKYLRITVGTEKENAALIAALQEILDEL